MKFLLSTSGYDYDEERAEELEKLGFKFKKESDSYRLLSKLPSEVSIQINSIQELLDFVEEQGTIVLSRRSLLSDLPGIEIYDDYRE